MTTLYTRADLCTLLSISTSTLDRWIQEGRFPAADRRIGPRMPRWTKDCVETALRAAATNGYS